LNIYLIEVESFDISIFLNLIEENELRIGELNVRSIRAANRKKNKALSLQALIQRYHLDILAVTETWLTESNETDAEIEGYQLWNANRKVLTVKKGKTKNSETAETDKKNRKSVKRGGGVAIYVREGIEIDESETREHTADTPYEYLKIKITKPFELDVICVYVNYPQEIQKTTEFFSYCIENRNKNYPFVAIGDFNVPANEMKSDIQKIENGFKVNQLVHSRTFKLNGNILDHIYVPKTLKTVKAVGNGVREVSDDLSDHNLISCMVRPKRRSSDPGLYGNRITTHLNSNNPGSSSPRSQS